MASKVVQPKAAGSWLKWSFFIFVAACFLAVLWVDERFWFNASDPHTRRILAFRTLLVLHGLTGMTALATGTMQMSSRIRNLWPALHRTLGNAYILAVCLSAPIAIYIGISPLEPAAIHVEQIFQGGLWLLCAAVAWICAKTRHMVLHKDWMIRSYGFTLVFVLSRVPDVFLDHYSDQFLADMLWSLVILALIAPEVITTAATLRRVTRRQRAA